jgi:serine/threonine protein phosphatase PrpC
LAIFEIASTTAAYREKCEDRVDILSDSDRVVIVVADGAGGIGSGDQAADCVVREVRAAFKTTNTEAGWVEMLSQIDCRIGMGESTAVIVDVSLSGLCGASVGDSQAWLILDGELDNLTSGQVRKPLLGTGEARPIGFSRESFAGLLIVATDGFCNYVKRPELVRKTAGAELCEVPRKLLEMVRLKSGELWDDVGIVACRKRRPQRSRTRYPIDTDEIA